MLGQTIADAAQEEASDGSESPFSDLFSSVNLERVLCKDAILESCV